MEKTPMLGNIEGKRSRGRQRMRWLNSITDSVDMDLSKLRRQQRTEEAVRCSPYGHRESGTTERLNNSRLCVACGAASLLL